MRMEYLTLTGRIINAFAVLITALCIAFFCDLKKVINNLGLRKQHILTIGILSSPENFESRSSIRETWLSFTSDFPLVHHFVVGKHLCNVHPSDRVSPYTCVENQLTVPKNVTLETEFSVLSPRKDEEVQGRSSVKVNAVGFGFETLRGITIKKLGVIKSVFAHVSDVRVKLRSSHPVKTLASVTVIRDMTCDDSDFVMKSIPPLNLEPNMEFQLVIEFISSDMGLLPSCDVFQWNQTPGVINYLQLIQFGDRKPWPFSSGSCSYVSMNYTIKDLDLLRSYVLGKEGRRREWRKTMNDINRKLKNESDFYGDITFVDVVDVYRNLPKKLVRFLQRLSDTELFHYFLKTDDDCFIDVERIYKQLVMLDEEVGGKNPGYEPSSTKLWWWSNYREFWKVQETGKWREDEYRSAAYPSFPCGGGYVINKGIVDYLSDNDVKLRFFQGEDISMGIWLSALETVQHRSPIAVVRGLDHSLQGKIIRRYGGDDAWITYFSSNKAKLVPDVCEWTCDNGRALDVPQCNRVQLTPDEMRDVWEKYTRQGFV